MSSSGVRLSLAVGLVLLLSGGAVLASCATTACAPLRERMGVFLILFALGLLVTTGITAARARQRR